MDNILVYSHETHHDVLELFNTSALKFGLINNYDCYLATSKEDNVSSFYSKVIIYNDKDPYAKRLINILEKLPGKNILLLHEDFILYNYINRKDLDTLNNLMKLNKELDYIRLIRSNDPIIEKYNDTNYLNVDYKNLCIQATIFDKDYLLNYLRPRSTYSIYDIENKGDEYSNGLFYYIGTERRVGAVHYESLIFPYTATAICKGKWNTEYKKELTDQFINYNFDKRGWT